MENLLRRGVRSVGHEAMKIVFDRELAPQLSPKERRTTLSRITNEPRKKRVE